MDIKELLKKYSVFILGLYFLAVGIVLIVRSALGTTPISSVNYVLSLNTPLSLNNDNYVSLNKKIKIDNIDINLVSLYYFEYGCILDFYTENINDLSSYNIDKTFEIKLTSPNFTNNYDIKSLFALKNDYLKNLSRNKNFNPKSKYTEFLSCNVNYDINTYYPWHGGSVLSAFCSCLYIVQ